MIFACDVSVERQTSAERIIKFRVIAKLSNGFYYANKKAVSRTTLLWNDILSWRKVPVIGLRMFPQEFSKFFMFHLKK